MENVVEDQLVQNENTGQDQQNPDQGTAQSLVLDDSMISKALEVATGGKIADKTTLENLLADYETLNTRVKEAEQRAKPLAGPLVEKINDLVAGGATPTELETFIRMQTIDPTALNPVDAIRMVVKSEHPYLNSAEVDAYIAEVMKLESAVEDRNLTPSESARLKTEHAKAVQRINSMKVSSEQPASLQDRIKSEQALQQRKVQTTQLVERIVSTLPGIQFKDEKGYSFTQPLDKQFIAQAKEIATELAISQGLDLSNPQHATSLQLQIDSMAKASQFESFVRAMYNDLESKLRAEIAKEYSGSPVRTSGQPIPAPAPSGNRVDPSKLMY